MQPVLDVLSKVELSAGKHDNPGDGLCVMECVAFVAGEPHTDFPACACEVAAHVAIHANDEYLDELHDALISRVLALAGSKVSPEDTRARAYLVVVQVMRVALPTGLKTRAPEVAAAFSALPVIDAPEKLDALDVARLKLDVNGPYSPFLVGWVESTLSALDASDFGSAAHKAMLVLDAIGPKIDLLKLLDDVLAIGAKPPLEPTPAIKLRVAQLAAQAELAKQPLVREI